MHLCSLCTFSARRAIAETRWGAEPVEVPEAMLKTRDSWRMDEVSEMNSLLMTSNCCFTLVCPIHVSLTYRLAQDKQVRLVGVSRSFACYRLSAVSP